MQKIRVKVVGDILLRSEGQELASIGSFLGGADIVLGNLETPLSTRGWPQDKLFTFRCNPERSRELAAHFQLLSLANNHSMDYGWAALEETIRCLNDAGTLTVGAGATLSEASKPVFLQVGTTKVGFISVSTLLPVGIRASES